MTLALKLALAPLLVAQAIATRRRAPVLPEAAGPREGIVGAGEPLRVLVVGDSSAAGVGVATQDRALAGHLTRTLAREAQRAVHWQLVARSGLATADALAFVQQAQPAPADLAVVVLGVNDVVGQAAVKRGIDQRAALADALASTLGVRHVAFAPLPPMDRFPLLPQPLRGILGRDARRLDAAVARWAATRDGVAHVPIAFDLGVEAMADDGFHPGEPVYRACGEALARHLARHLETKR